MTDDPTQPLDQEPISKPPQEEQEEIESSPHFDAAKENQTRAERINEEGSREAGGEADGELPEEMPEEVREELREEEPEEVRAEAASAEPIGAPQAAQQNGRASSLDNLNVAVDFQIGSITLPVNDLANLAPGWTLKDLPNITFPKVVALSAGRAFAEGELVEIDGKLGFRITQILS